MTGRLIKEISEHYVKLLGFAPRRTNLQVLSPVKWQDFCNKLGLDVTAEGIFVPRNLTAIINEQAKFPELSLFHEYFGHGLFCEYAQDGRRLCQSEERLLRAERKEFQREKFSLEQLIEFRRSSPPTAALQNQKEKMLCKYESFAIWTENYLANLLGFNELFEKKHSGAPAEALEGFEKLKQFQKEAGELAVFYEMGMPRYPAQERVMALMRGMFKDKVESIKLAILHGSRRSYSDIDLVVVADTNFHFYNGWLDIRSFNPKQFEYGLAMFDLPIIDALTNGEFILGDESYFRLMKQRASSQPVTTEAVYYNIIKAKEALNLSKSFRDDVEKEQKSQSYSRNYALNALRLKQRQHRQIA